MKKKTPFEICYSLLTDVDVRTDKSPSDMDEIHYMREHFEDVFEMDTEQYSKWYSRLGSRTDMSDDDRWVLETLEDDLSLLFNIRDNLRKSGAIR